jgi:hypothetical protein
MGRDVGFKVEGLNALVRDLQAIGVEVDDLKDAFSTISKEGAERAAHHAPRGETGKLSASIRGNRAKSKAVVTAGRATVPYAGAINYGWPGRNIEPAGFMQKADEEMQPVALQRLEEEINRVIRSKGLG